MKMQNTAHRSTVRVLLATTFLLSIPLVATLFGRAAWDLFDFAVMGALLIGTGLTYESAVRKMGTTAYRAAVGVALAASFLLVWINLAVGIIGSEDDPANLMYLGVLAVGIVGALLARFQPRGMERTLFATSLAQAVVAVIALVFGMGAPWSPPLEIVTLNGFFVALFVGSALLFRRAAREQARAGAGSVAG